MTRTLLCGSPAAGDGAPKWHLAHFARATVGTILKRVFSTRFIGAEHIPEGGAILAGNHESYLDPILLWCVVPRPVHFVAKEELWGTSWLGYLLDHFYAFPVKRGTADREMITTATRLLAHGDMLGMFPEGTRKRTEESDELGEAHGGVAFLAIRADIPVIPVGFAGTSEAWPAGAKWPRFVPVRIHAGAPVYPSEFEGGRKERVSAMTARIMERIAEVRDAARGE